jgi:hypothetical protein
MYLHSGDLLLAEAVAEDGEDKAGAEDDDGLFRAHEDSGIVLPGGEQRARLEGHLRGALAGATQGV